MSVNSELSWSVFCSLPVGTGLKADQSKGNMAEGFDPNGCISGTVWGVLVLQGTGTDEENRNVQVDMVRGVSDATNCGSGDGRLRCNSSKG